MRIGLNLGYWQAGPPPDMAATLRTAEEAGLDSIWTSEAYGSDALTPLAWWGAHTTTLRLGTAVMQMSARTPTAAAMAALTLDHLSNGRFNMGLGVSGPQIVEGWYGQPYTRPLERTREYISIVRSVFRREQPVSFSGKHYQLPLSPENSSASVPAMGLGKPLKSTVHPLRTNLPIHLAAEGPKNIALAAELCDGWLPFLYSPTLDHGFRDFLAEGFARRPDALSPQQEFEVNATVPVVPHESVEHAAQQIRPFLALYIGGMGAKKANFHRAALERLGYAKVCADVASLYEQGKTDDAANAIPLELIDEVALIGPVKRIAANLHAWEKSVVTSILVHGPLEAALALVKAQSLNQKK
ncbi:LLM class F420-dependent oxidoreductase [Timonella sp. A28]|uniref:LLM class F420-dependent oxidoreductase n=1 Tax=Timonella sp. A28 TaxID=3442640 RepID=UPI003EB7457F